MLPGMFPGGGTYSQELPSVSLADTDVTFPATNAPSTTMDFGAVGRGRTRYLILVVTGGDGDGDTSFTISATIGGVTATQVKAPVIEASSADGETGFVWMGIAAVPSGTSGTVTATLTGFSGTMDNIAFALYRAVGLSSATPTTTPSNTSSNTLTLVVPANGFGIGAGAEDGGDQTCGAFSGTNTNAAYNGSYGVVMHRTVAGSQAHASSNTDCVLGATWTFT